MKYSNNTKIITSYLSSFDEILNFKRIYLDHALQEHALLTIIFLNKAATSLTWPAEVEFIRVTSLKYFIDTVNDIINDNNKMISIKYTPAYSYIIKKY